MSGCCGPARTGAPAGELAGVEAGASRGPARLMEPGRLVDLTGGQFLMGSDEPGAYAEDGEGPVRSVRVAPFRIDPLCVTVGRFAAFVAETGHRTDAERYGASFVFAGLLPSDFPPTRGVAGAPWWREVPGVDWRHPEGAGSSVADRLNHPVVHVSRRDAQAYSAWAGLRLPTEAEWEFAARGGLEQRRFPWGDKLRPAGQHRMNIWQGRFPDRNTGADGYLGTAPVDAYEPNAYGLHNATGNVWEWTADPFDPGRAALRGGSYLCHASYCYRFRVSARMGSTSDSSAGNVGFRCAADLAASREGGVRA